MASDVTVAPLTASTSMVAFSAMASCITVAARPPRFGVSMGASMVAATTLPEPRSTVSSTVTSPPKPGTVAEAVASPVAAILSVPPPAHPAKGSAAPTAPASQAAPQSESAPQAAPAQEAPAAPVREDAPQEPFQEEEEQPSYINVMQILVEEKADEYMKMFGICCCDKCRVDVRAYALNHLPPKYVVLSENERVPRLTVYENRFASDITAQLIQACKQVMLTPHHSREDS